MCIVVPNPIMNRRLKALMKNYKLSTKNRGIQKSSLLFYLFISPWLLGFFLLTLGPMLFSLYTSFTQWNGISKPKFIGLLNFQHMLFKDGLFWKSVINTMYYAGISVPLDVIIALILAVILNKKLFGSYFFRTVFYLPSVVSGVAVYLVWWWLYDPKIGIFNYLLSLVGITGPNWLTDPNWAMPSMIIMSITSCGGAMLIFLAGLQDIPAEYYEAARIDGSSGLKTFFNITLPLLSPVIFFNVVMGIISGVQVFMQPWIMTNGGPLQATYVYSIHIYKTAFQYFDFAYASALAWVLFVLMLLISAIVFAIAKKTVFYGEDIN